MSNNTLTDRPEWKTLACHQQEMAKRSLKNLFADDPQRFEKHTLALPGFFYDYSKTHVNDETIDLLCALAKACGLEDRRAALYSGQKINVTENRAALHMALRGSQPEGLKIDGEDVATFVKATLAQIKTVTERIRADKNITDIIHIGIGGSDLGPRMVCRALALSADGPRIHFLPNVDGHCFYELSRTLCPKHTAVIVVSKTFTTMETLTNAESVRQWMKTKLDDQTLSQRMIGVTMNVEKAEDFGIARDNILPLRDWIGGRFSLWGAVGLPIAIANGFKEFEQLLAGAHAADKHFLNAPLKQNIPMLMGLIGIWQRNFEGYNALAILSYAQHLEHFKTYVQQLDMESNGKGVDLEGRIVSYATGPVIFGETGTNAQHAFMQLLHQSSEIIPVDFILVAHPDHPFRDHHVKLLSNALAQAKALMDGSDHDDDAPYSRFDGNRPSTTSIIERLDAYHLGMLIAFYEHKIFVQGAIWGINSFDQWGVELGKTIAKELIENFDNRNKIKGLDQSTSSLLEYLHTTFTKC